MKAEEKNKIEKFMDSRGWFWGDIFYWDDVRGLISEYAAPHQEGGEEFTRSEDVPPHNLFTEDEDSPTTLPQISEGEIDRLWDKYCDTAHEAPEWMFKEHFKEAIHQLMKGGEVKQNKGYHYDGDTSSTPTTNESKQ